MKRPNRGEVWVVDLGMAAKTRPCLVLSIPIHDEDRVLATVIPHTTSVRNTRFEVQIAKRFLKEGAFDVQNLITVPCAKLIHRIGQLSANEMQLVETAVTTWLGLRPAE